MPVKFGRTNFGDLFYQDKLFKTFLLKLNQNKNLNYFC